MIVQKGAQVTKPIIVVKMPCKLLYVIQVKGFLMKCSTSWPYLISELLVAYNYRGVVRPGHTQASGYFALPSAAFPAIKMVYKLYKCI